MGTSFCPSLPSSPRSGGQAGGGAAPTVRPVPSQTGSKWQPGAPHRPKRVLQWNSDKAGGEVAVSTGTPGGWLSGAWWHSPQGKGVFRGRFGRGQP